MDDQSWMGLLGGAAPLFTEAEQPRWLKKALEKIKPGDITTSLRTELSRERLEAELRAHEQPPSEKPKGLWFACGPDWLEFAWREEMIQRQLFVYKLELQRRGLLRLETSEQMLGFTQTFGTFYDRGSGEPELLIDWSKVSVAYTGIMICPRQLSLRYSLDWYTPWDVASGCIWDSRAVRSWKRIS